MKWNEKNSTKNGKTENLPHSLFENCNLVVQGVDAIPVMCTRNYLSVWLNCTNTIAHGP